MIKTSAGEAMDLERYASQFDMPEIGSQGQKRLADASAFVAGAGGLGSVLLQCLCAAGVGHIGLADDDTVSLSNLNRQLLYTEADIGRKKAERAAEKLRALNSQTIITAYDERITDGNAPGLISGYDVVLAAVDSVAARLVLNRACCVKRLPLINGGVDGMNGELRLVLPGKTACLECVGAHEEPEHSPASFAPVVSTVSAMMAQTALLLLLGREPAYAHELVWLDCTHLKAEHIRLNRRESCTVCAGL